MAAVLGLDCVAYINSDALLETPTGTADWDPVNSVTGVEVSNTLATADITRRGGNGYRQKVGTLAEGDVTFDLIYDTADTFFDTVDTAYRNRTTLDMWFGSDTIATNGARGFRAAFAVTDFSESQQLEDAIRYSVTLSVSGSTPTPGYYDSNGTVLALIT